MNTEWSLDEIYKGFDDKAYEADFKTLEEEIKKFGAAVKATDKELLAKVEELLSLEEKVTLVSGKLSLYIGLRQSVNTDDGEIPQLPEPERGFGIQVIGVNVNTITSMNEKAPPLKSPAAALGGYSSSASMSGSSDSSVSGCSAVSSSSCSSASSISPMMNCFCLRLFFLRYAFSRSKSSSGSWIAMVLISPVIFVPSFIL